jgi:hypothetical protein
VTPIEHRSVIEVEGARWRFSCPEAVRSTSTADAYRQPDPLVLEFAVSRDEEHVELRARCGERTFDLGSRTHNYLLLTLARQRLADAASGLPDTSCGWTYQDELLQGLDMSQTQLNIDVFRIRKHFARAGLQEHANVVERRPQSRQLRIGVGELQIRTL